MTGYVFDNSWEHEHARLAGLEALYDPGTIRHLETLGITQGWSCLEIAAGAGSIARWLSQRVGTSGKVVATDIDTRFLEVMPEPNIDVRRHNLTADELPGDEFDLIHGRAIIEHLPDPEQAIAKLAAALKPGGWMLLEDTEWSSLLAEPDHVIMHPATGRPTLVKVWRAILELMQKSGYNESAGRHLPGFLISQGLIDVGSELRASLVWGGSPASPSAIGMIERFQEDLIGASDVTEQDIDEAISWLSDPSCASVRPALVAAWGRRPHDPAGLSGAGRGMPPRTETVRSWLRTSPLFARSSEVELSRVASLADELHVEEGEQLTVEGQPGNTFFVIAKGTATVSRGGKRLVGLGPGSYFGEIALLEQGPRTATVTADSRMWLFVFDAKGFASLMNGMPAVSDEIFRALAERKRNVKRD